MNADDHTYGSERKLNFLCSLDLFPTPLIKKCPNATKRWLRAAVPTSPDATHDIGINARYELDQTMNKIDFVTVSMNDATSAGEGNHLIFSNLSTDHTYYGTTPAKEGVALCGGSSSLGCFEHEKSVYAFSTEQCNMRSALTPIPPSNNDFNYTSAVNLTSGVNLTTSEVGLLTSLTTSDVDNQSLIQDGERCSGVGKDHFIYSTSEENSSDMMVASESKGGELVFNFENNDEKETSLNQLKQVQTSSNQFTCNIDSTFSSYGLLTQDDIDIVVEEVPDGGGTAIRENDLCVDVNKMNVPAADSSSRTLILNQNVFERDEIVTPGVNQNIFTISPICDAFSEANGHQFEPLCTPKMFTKAPSTMMKSFSDVNGRTSKQPLTTLETVDETILKLSKESNEPTSKIFTITKTVNPGLQINRLSYHHPLSPVVAMSNLTTQGHQQNCTRFVHEDPPVVHQQIHNQQFHREDPPADKKLKESCIDVDLQEAVLSEIVSQEINQTIFAKASIGKTQGYLSELLRTSKLLGDKCEKNYRRTRHNLEKIRLFLRKPRQERKQIYDEIALLKKSSIREVKKGTGANNQPLHEKQKRTVLTDETKIHLSDFFKNHVGKVSSDDYQLLSSQLKLDLQSVKVFHKNWKQRTKIKSTIS